MASFSSPSSNSPALCNASQANPNQQKLLQHCSVSFQSCSPALIGCSSLTFQGSRRTDAFKVSAQLNEVALKKPSNSALAAEENTEEPPKASDEQNSIPDASSISAFMTQVADLVKLVDSRDIMELQLKQQDCEVIIRKKEALQQQPVVMMQQPAPHAMVPSQPPLPPVSALAPAGPVSSSPASPAALPSPGKPETSHPPLKSPMAGTFYRSPAPGAPPFVKVGDKVQKGQVVCIIEAMKLMNEIESDQSGTVVKIIADDGKPVSVDTPLFIIKP